MVEIAKKILKQVQDDGIKTKLVELSGPEGIVFARVRGFEEASHEYIACIDGDSYALKSWLWRLISRLHRRKNVAVGGGVWLTGGLIPSLMSLDFFWLKPIYIPFIRFWSRFAPQNDESDDGWNGNYFWGANFAVRKSVYEKVGGLIPFIQLNQKLGLSLAPEDLYLAKKVSEVGRVEIEPWAVVVSKATKTNWKIRTKLQGQDRKKLINYINRS